MFSYENQTNVLNDLAFINYEHRIFELFKISDSSRYGQLFVIPQQFITMFEDVVVPQSYRVDLNYSLAYCTHHKSLVEQDKSAYLAGFGFYNF